VRVEIFSAAKPLDECRSSCTSCGALLAGQYCHRCSQQRVSATTSLLWTALPLIDLAVPIDLARSEAAVAGITLGMEVVCATYAVHDWLQRSIVMSLAGVASVLSVGYFGLALLLGPEHAVSFAPLSVLTRHGAGG
jgi:hypothetical protein